MPNAKKVAAWRMYMTDDEASEVARLEEDRKFLRERQKQLTADITRIAARCYAREDTEVMRRAREIAREELRAKMAQARDVAAD